MKISPVNSVDLVCKKDSLNSINQYLRSGEPQTLDLILTTTINSEKTVVNTKPLVKELNFAIL